MPRVVQVETHCDLNANIRSGDHQDNDGVESGSEDELNRNYNQTEQIGDMHPSMLRFPINYELYNVTYSPSEDEAYCLTCNVGGKIVKYKKDARVWLHKNGGRKRKHEAQEYEGDDKRPLEVKGENDSTKQASTDNFLESEQRRLMRIQEYFQNVCTRYDKYRTSGIHIDSDLESLGESEADLTYSEETTPSTSLTEACFQNPLHTTTPGDSGTEQEVGRKDALLHLAGSDSNPVEGDVEEDVDTLANASGNNNRTRIRYYELARRLAPAIHMENESFAESLLDTAAFSVDCVAANTRLQTRNKRFETTNYPLTRSRTKTGRRRPYEPTATFRYRTQTRGGVAKKKPTSTIKEKSSTKYELCRPDTQNSTDNIGLPVSYFHASSAKLKQDPDKSDRLTNNNTHPAAFTVYTTKDKPSSDDPIRVPEPGRGQSTSRGCASQNAEPGPSCQHVPSLFTLASLAAYKHFNAVLDSHT